MSVEPLVDVERLQFDGPHPTVALMDAFLFDLLLLFLGELFGDLTLLRPELRQDAVAEVELFCFNGFGTKAGFS